MQPLEGVQTFKNIWVDFWQSWIIILKESFCMSQLRPSRIVENCIVSQ